MPARRKSIPSYLLHKQSGRARAAWTDPSGERKQQLLPGAYNSPESRAAFGALVMELESSPHRTLTNETRASVSEVLLAFIEHAETHYRRPDGTATNEVAEYKLVIRYTREMYGETIAADFGPLALKAVRQKFIAAGWARRFINQRVGRIRRMFKWAAGEELIPFDAYQRLTAVAGLQVGRTTARETEPIGPVADSVVDATLPHLNRHVRGLVEFQRLTGCRPGEACAIRRSDIDTGGAVWIYRPTAHKNSWRGKARTIAVGPKAQVLLREFFTPDLGGYLFSPRRAVEEIIAERAAKRATPRYPSHVKRNAAKRKAKPQRVPAERYARLSYALAVSRGCERAFTPPPPLAQCSGETRAEWRARLTEGQRAELADWRKLHHWHPNQLRHSFGTRVRKEHGLEAAQVSLGHARADVTQIYAERNQELAASVAAKIG